MQLAYANTTNPKDVFNLPASAKYSALKYPIEIYRGHEKSPLRAKLNNNGAVSFMHKDSKGITSVSIISGSAAPITSAKKEKQNPKA